MSELWFWMVAVLLTLWAVLDGFDFGVGALHRFVARTDSERAQVIGSIGPVWDGNEVWLVAAGGSMLLAFPRLLAAGFSGFYLPVIFIVWALILRGVSIELRHHLDSPLWRSFFDSTLVVSSIAVPFLMGAALGNVIRGVPLDANGFFELPLFPAEGRLGVVDGYTFLIGLLTVVTLVAHGANWLVLKTDGEVQKRASALRLRAWGAVIVLWIAALIATARVWPDFVSLLGQRPIAWLGSASALAGLVVIFSKRESERAAFFGGVAFIAGVLVATVAALFPLVLRGVNGAADSMTVNTAASTGSGMSAGVWWWVPGISLAALWYWWVFRHFRGKVALPAPGESGH
ncbi:MAG: cytochrome d ubiquinol oxidase subunit II [Archangium sp.]